MAGSCKGTVMGRSKSRRQPGTTSGKPAPARAAPRRRRRIWRAPRPWEPKPRKPSMPPKPAKNDAGILRALRKAASKKLHRRYALHCLYCGDGVTVAGTPSRMHIYYREIASPGLHLVHKPQVSEHYFGCLTGRDVERLRKGEHGEPMPWRQCLPDRDPRWVHPLKDVYRWLARAMCMAPRDGWSKPAIDLHGNLDGSLGMTAGSIYDAGTAEIHMRAGATHVATVDGRYLRDALDWLARCGDSVCEITATLDVVRLDGDTATASAVVSALRLESY